MARIRTIKPDTFTDEKFVALSPLARLFYIALWCEADREGRLEWNLNTLKWKYLPADQCDIQAIGAEIVSAGRVVLYTCEGKMLALIPTFVEHQHINQREAKSRLPSPPGAKRVCARASTCNTPPKQVGAHGEGKGRELEGKEEEPPVAPQGARARKVSDIEYSNAFKRLMEVYPSRGDARNPWPPAWKAWLAALERGGEPETIIAAAERYAKTESAGTKYTAQTATWLNQDDWKQVPPAPAQPVADPEETRWAARLAGWERSRFWNRDQWGGAPGEAGCLVPARLLPKSKDDFDPERDMPAHCRQASYLKAAS